MTIHFADPHLTVHIGDCRDVLRELPERSVHTVVTSPPYWGLRDYGTATWEGGEDGCDHARPNARMPHERRASTLGGGVATVAAQDAGANAKHVCDRCGARRIDAQLGLEPTPEEYVADMVAVFREVRRVLRDDGTVWLNLGDSYAAGGGDTKAGFNERYKGKAFATDKQGETPYATAPKVTGLKPKDLVGIPWRVAFALQADGWVLRSDVVWAKPNPMPESVTDRPTKSHEYLFLLSKARWVGPCDPPTWMSETDKAWLAALVDGEGTICFQERERGDMEPHVGIRLSVVNTNRDLLERITKITNIDGGPGSASPRYRSDGTSGRPIYAWQATDAKAATIIAAIRPYLIAKRTQADLALAGHILNQTKRGNRVPRTTADETGRKRRLAAACSDLNHGRDVDLSWFTPPDWGKWVPEKYMYDADAVREPHNENTMATTGRAIERGNGRQVVQIAEKPERGAGDGKPLFAERWLNPAGRNLRSVWSIATQPYPGAHFATFPEALVAPCVKAGCPPDGTVLDPFGGSGTTARVANRLGRRAILIDLSADYIDQAMARNAQAPLGMLG